MTPVSTYPTALPPPSSPKRVALLNITCRFQREVEKYKEETRGEKEEVLLKDKVGGFLPHLAKPKEKQELLPVTAFYPSQALNLSTEM